jgi:signal peptidase
MLPRLHTGDLVLVERQSSYHLGEVVAYRVPKGQVGAGHVVIHRIVGGNGTTGWRVKGDNRTAPDLWYPTNHDVIGAKLLRIPDAWFVLRILHMPVLLALVAACCVFFLIALGGSGEPGDAGEEVGSR